VDSTRGVQWGGMYFRDPVMSLKNLVYCVNIWHAYIHFLSCQTSFSLFPAGSDFNVTVFDFTFAGGSTPEIILASQFPAIDDTLPELTEGFLCYLEVVNSSLDPRDRGRIDFFNRITLVRIQDNDCEPQFIRLYHSSMYSPAHPGYNCQEITYYML